MLKRDKTNNIIDQAMHMLKTNLNRLSNYDRKTEKRLEKKCKEKIMGKSKLKYISTLKDINYCKYLTVTFVQNLYLNKLF